MRREFDGGNDTGSSSGVISSGNTPIGGTLIERLGLLFDLLRDGGAAVDEGIITLG